MTPQQDLFFRQAASDWEVFHYLRQASPTGVPFLIRQDCLKDGIRIPVLPVCHELHYLQMCTEKLAKAYFDDGNRPADHAAFRKMFKSLRLNHKVIGPLGLSGIVGLIHWLISVEAIVDALEDLAPAIADSKNRPNPEYPWPRVNPTIAPVDYSFKIEVVDLLEAQARSGQPSFLVVLQRLFDTMREASLHL